VSARIGSFGKLHVGISERPTVAIERGKALSLELVIEAFNHGSRHPRGPALMACRDFHVSRDRESRLPLVRANPARSYDRFQNAAALRAGGP
jgi:hypothetical protein